MLIRNNPNSTENQIKERIRSMLEKVKRTGTSQDESECVHYSNYTTYRGFVCLIAQVPKNGRFKGIAEPIEIEAVKELHTPFTKDINTAGRELYKIIDMIRNGKN